MAFSFAVKLLAFASTAQANEVAETATDALAGEPAPSATTLQQRNLRYSYRDENYYNSCDQNVEKVKADEICCRDSQCPSHYECYYDRSNNSNLLRCQPAYVSKSYGIGIIAAKDYGLALTGGMGISTLVVALSFLIDVYLLKKWTKGYFVQLTAIALQFSSTIATFYFVTDTLACSDEYRKFVWWISVPVFLLSELILILGMKMNSYWYRPSPKARRGMLIGAGLGGCFTALFGGARYLSVKDVQGPLKL